MPPMFQSLVFGKTTAITTTPMCDENPSNLLIQNSDTTSNDNVTKGEAMTSPMPDIVTEIPPDDFRIHQGCYKLYF